MKHATMKRTIPAILLTAAAAVPAGSALAATHAASSAAKAAKAQTFKGSLESSRWGPVQVNIVVKSKKITNVIAVVSTHTSRSGFIDSLALPALKSEVLAAQSANINSVSGATDISDAYVQSLQNAISSARQHKALK